MSDLRTWLNNGWLKQHTSSREEIADLFEVVDRDLEASLTPGLHTDWAYNIAYNAALQLATPALAAAGYKADRSNHHFRVIQSLELTIGADPALIRKFDLFRKKRNMSDYERANVVSELEAREMRELARKPRGDVGRWIESNHRHCSPDL